MRPPKVLLLDAGNTLVFLDYEALAEAARDVGQAVSAADLCRAEPTAKRAYEAKMQEGMAHEEGWLLHMQVIFETAGLDPEAARVASAAARTVHDAFNLWRKVPPELPGALARARTLGLRLGVVSNAEGHLESLLSRVGLLNYFEHVIDSGREEVRKPDPAIFQLALNRMRVASHDSLYAGDIPQVDVDGARAAGIDAVLIDALDHYPEYSAAPRYRSVAELLQNMGI